MSCGCHMSSRPESHSLSGSGSESERERRQTKPPAKPQPAAESGLFRFMNRRLCRHATYEPTKVEHWANVLSHGIAIVPAIFGIYVLYWHSYYGTQTLTALVYGGATVMLFIASTTYHVAELLFRPRFRLMRFWLHVGDRAGIYLYIAASYQPWLTLRDCGWLGYPTLILVWLAACAGVVYQYVFHERFKTLETLLYVLIGACPALVATKMTDQSGLFIVAAAGACYVVGILFFKSDGVIPFAHAIWHFHVVVGALLQFIAVDYYLMGPDNQFASQIKSGIDNSRQEL